MHVIEYGNGCGCNGCMVGMEHGLKFFTGYNQKFSDFSNEFEMQRMTL